MMKNLKKIVLGLLTVLVGLVLTACPDRGKDGPQSPHLEMGPVNFKTAIDYRIKNNEPYIIVDYRSKEDYDKGHVPGAVWLMQGSVDNMDNNVFAKAVLSECGGNKNAYVFLVGGNSTGLQMTMGGSVSGIGFGKNHTIVLAGGFKVWQAQNEKDPENFPIEKTEKE